MLPAFSNYPLCFQTLAHSLAQLALRNSFGINSLRTVSHATEGVPPTPCSLSVQICTFIFNHFHDAPPATLFLSCFCIVARGWGYSSHSGTDRAGGTVRLAHRQECLCPRANADSTRPRAEAKRIAPFGRLRPSRNGCATGRMRGWPSWRNIGGSGGSTGRRSLRENRTRVRPRLHKRKEETRAGAGARGCRSRSYGWKSVPLRSTEIRLWCRSIPRRGCITTSGWRLTGR